MDKKTVGFRLFSGANSPITFEFLKERYFMFSKKILCCLCIPFPFTLYHIFFLLKPVDSIKNNSATYL